MFIIFLVKKKSGQEVFHCQKLMKRNINLVIKK